MDKKNSQKIIDIIDSYKKPVVNPCQECETSYVMCSSECARYHDYELRITLNVNLASIKKEIEKCYKK